MSVLVVAVVLVGVLGLANLVLTMAVVRRLGVHSLRLAELGPPQSRMVAPGTPLAEFEATTLGGSPVSRASFTGQTVVGVFSTECESCHERVPEFAAYLKGAAPEKAFALVTGDAERVATFAEQLEPVATVVVESMGGPLGRALQISQFPSFYLIDGDAVIVAADTDPGRLPVVARPEGVRNL
ncbi:TlpA family protein disulfide reductase [Spirillospora sp. NPDC048911]|uniref:TlpA family protein disulfide reductase n=1 Tax=Spirillospora sp. NPDC048911 TaxID=3364527 RepID=UPI0037203CB0